MPTFTEAVTATAECTRSSTGKVLCESSTPDAVIAVVIILAVTALLLLGTRRLANRRRRR